MKKLSAAQAAILPVAIFAAINLGGCSKEPPKLSEPLKNELDKAVAELACMPAEPFPYDSNDHPNLTCNDCDKLVNAGLLSKEQDAAPEAPQPGFAPQFGMQHAHFRYELTDIGRSAYVPSDSGNTAYGASHFCFGKAHVLQITRIFGPVMLGGRKNIGIRFIAQLDDPNPYIFDSRARQLNIPLPSAAMEGKPALYPERDVTAVINPNNPNDLYLDGGMHIGPIGDNPPPDK